MQTTLLSVGMAAQEKHYLVSLQEGYEDILLSYYPFLIGKAEYMTDYALLRDSVSRLHVKIERTEQGFQITDLNSTNGTWVGEHLLEANETFPLKENDKIRLADLTFWFK
ncbi:MAG: FHA domain-containing protein [bacterium]|nr:FHA domain-containing protein [bacterium]